MSDQFYAVEFRSMHTAIHNIFVYSTEQAAQEFLDLIAEHEEIPDTYIFDENTFVGEQEINFRHKTHHFKDMPIIYINDELLCIHDWQKNRGFVPDVYNY